MLAGNKLQDEVEAREAAKIRRKREMNEERRQRILNPKTRIMGLDIAALDQQVAEKKQNVSDKMEMDRFERNQAMEIERLLAASIEEERQMKEYQMNEIKKNWEGSIHEKKIARQAPKQPDFDPDNCGPSSLQKCSGEDSNRVERLRVQKNQMRNWVQEQMSEKAYVRKVQKDEDMQYAEMIKAVDAVREQTEREEQELRKYVQNTMKTQNNEVAAKRRAEREEQERLAHQFAPASLQCFNEDKEVAMNERGRVVRVDMFKGFTKDQLARIHYENQSLMMERSSNRDYEKRQDAEWAIQQNMALKAMELAEYEEKQLREQQNEERLAYLRDQIVDQKTAKNEWNKSKYGSVGKGFYDGFGTSCR